MSKTMVFTDLLKFGDEAQGAGHYFLPGRGGRHLRGVPKSYLFIARGDENNDHLRDGVRK